MDSPLNLNGWSRKHLCGETFFVGFFFSFIFLSVAVYASDIAHSNEWNFPKNQISIGYFNKNFFDPHIPRPPSPIFWHAVKSVQNGGMVMYQRLIFHNRKLFSLYVGGSLSRWVRFDQIIYAESAFFALRFWFFRTSTVNAYLTYSVAGPTILNINHLAEKNLGGNFIFQDYLGLGLQFGRRHALNLDLRLVHYSNGDIFTHNPGFDVPVVLYLGYSF